MTVIYLITLCKPCSSHSDRSLTMCSVFVVAEYQKAQMTECSRRTNLTDGTTVVDKGALQEAGSVKGKPHLHFLVTFLELATRAAVHSAGMRSAQVRAQCQAHVDLIYLALQKVKEPIRQMKCAPIQACHETSKRVCLCHTYAWRRWTMDSHDKQHGQALMHNFLRSRRQGPQEVCSALLRRYPLRSVIVKLKPARLPNHPKS